MDDWRRWNYFPPSRPIAARGGIRAQSRRGRFGGSWWANRWIAVLESFNLGARLNRGRSYARRGQVLSIAVESGAVIAKVQGSRPAPYDVRIAVKPLSPHQWTQIAEVIGSQAIFGARLLAGEMPRDIEEAFGQAKLSLFPARHSDLLTECSCPDWSNPCKHVAAVYYLLGEEFDRDPFLIFQLRGMGREDFLRTLGDFMPPADDALGEPIPGEPLPSSPASFWKAAATPENLAGLIDRQHSGAVLPRRLGKFPFWRGRENFLESLESIYTSAASRTAQKMLAAES